MCDEYQTLLKFTQKKVINSIFHVVIIFLSMIIMGLSHSDKDNYGPYQILWKKFETCKGPKQTDCGKFEIKDTQNMSDVIFYIDFAKECPATSAKIVVSTMSNNTTKKLWNYALNKPCEHFVLGPVLVQSFNLTKTCKVNKGQYDVHLDFKAKAYMFLGKNFFYGTYVFKTMSYNKVNNFFCVQTVLEIIKPV